jgi:hypothetical protein
VRLYGLVLSMMRNEKWEYSDRLAAWSESREKLEALLRDEKVETYEDHGDANCVGNSRWVKTFRKGGPLEWYNSVSAQFGSNVIVEVEDPTTFAYRVAGDLSIPSEQKNDYFARAKAQRELMLSSSHHIVDNNALPVI